ncbi:MAG: TetR/AcrR family transcriptional regulator [Actinomycetota bacterium]|nr:TetR/AcrR family transcriptional regulator [Actinomycetota bacterium]
MSGATRPTPPIDEHEQPDREPDGARRLPEQSRSRERVEHVLDAAAALITESGIDAMTMSRLAETAEVSLPSIYRYFPNKRAILATLFDRYAARVRHAIAAPLADIDSREAARDALAAAMRRYWELYRSDAALAAVFSAALADPELVGLDVADSRTNGALLAEALAPGLDAAPDERAAFVASHLAGATVRLGVLLERDEADEIVELLIDRVLVPLLLGEGSGEP